MTNGDDGTSLGIEPVTGWRVWRLLERDGGYRLHSITRSDRWQPREPFTATCRWTDHRAPVERCSCGVYAASTPERLARSGVFSGSESVVGTVAMWGTVVEHDAGVRAASVYPARLRLVCGACLRDGRGAREPRVVIGTGGVLFALCRLHAIGRKGRRRPAAEVQAALLSAYAVDLLPLERVATAVRVPDAPAVPRDVRRTLERVALMVLGGVLNVAMAIWALSGFVFLAYWIVAIVVDLFTPGE